MKNVLFLLVFMISSVQAVIAQTWKSYETPGSAQAVTVLDTEILLATYDQLYVASFPLPDEGNINWLTLPTPGTGLITNLAHNAGIIYLLRDGILYSDNGNGFIVELEGINNFAISSDNYPGICAWTDNQVLLKREGNWSKKDLPNIVAAALDLHTLVLFEANGNHSLGLDLNSLNPLQNLEDLIFKEAAYSYGSREYCVAGYAIGDLAAWYKSSKFNCNKYSHILSYGQLFSCTAYGDSIYAAGFIGSKGVVFNTDDLSEIYFTRNSINQVRGNKNIDVLVAIDYKNLHVRGATPLSNQLKKPSTKEPMVIIANGYLQIDSEKEEHLDIFSIDGKLIKSTRLLIGENLIPLGDLKRGTYVLSTGQKFVY